MHTDKQVIWEKGKKKTPVFNCSSKNSKIILVVKTYKMIMNQSLGFAEEPD